MLDAAACLFQTLLAGPLPVSDFMAFCLAHPVYGSYMGQNPLGRDFITAPEVSQMFGELIGLSYANACLAHNQPHLWVECGPGRGTLTVDALRAARPYLPFIPEIHFIEISPVLQSIQAKTTTGLPVAWHETLERLPTNTPLFVVANEWLDALPVEQYVLTPEGWYRRCVEKRGEDLAFTVDSTSPAPTPVALVLSSVSCPLGSVFEYPALGLRMLDKICGRLVHQGGQAMIIDYGPEVFGVGDTLQAVYQGKMVDVFLHIGQADLSCHVPFGLFKSHVQHHYPALSCTLTSQGRFLHDQGILTRLATLMRQNPNQAEVLGAAYHRLTHPTQMGSLFKVLTITPIHNQEHAEA